MRYTEPLDLLEGEEVSEYAYQKSRIMIRKRKNKMSNWHFYFLLYNNFQRIIKGEEMQSSKRIKACLDVLLSKCDSVFIIPHIYPMF